MPPPKLHLNEHLSPRLAEQLRQYSFDVTSTLELNMVEADDDEQLAYAASNQRAIVTFNHKDFAVRHSQ
jgi:predicted nuclease of predicted toxin-antitoxin system